MKAGFETVNHGSTLDHPMTMIQTHEPWNISSNVRPCLNLNKRNELSEWVEQITKQLIDDDDDENDNEANTFPTSNDNNNNIIKYHHVKYDHDHCLSLMTLLFESAVAISVDNFVEARRLLLELSETASPYAPSCAERVVAYFAQAMSTRVINTSLGVPYHDVTKNLYANYRNYQNTLLRNSFQAFNDVAPFLKFAHFTSNQAILEAFHGQPFVHVIDLDFLHVGLFQWPALLHALATRPEGPPSHVRLTALAASSDHLSDAAKNLSGFAKRLGISFEFNPVGSDTDFSDLRVRIRRVVDEREALAVHWLRHHLYEANGSEWKTMRLVEELRPRILTLVEQDMSWHGGSFLDRFVGSLHYYSTLSDALGACLGTDDLKRNEVESGVVYREISNVLGVAGRSGSGEEIKIGSWRREMAARGCLAQVAMSANAAAQAQLIVNMFGGGGGGYRVVQGDGTLRLGWKETSLYTVSAWTSCTYNVFR
ncbi:hypothetical protein L484_005640 [Morus notabilis]|uniref:Uncharacterized protein n=1 Tax=Morus notabilis TaxID=981085 RepID=W9RFI0_9ROSA|nr:scarecrow-like protein 23 [Morus notabilis]EXB88370.1 hypothetical protein L484_005640 [Morus notabilis]